MPSGQHKGDKITTQQQSKDDQDNTIHKSTTEVVEPLQERFPPLTHTLVALLNDDQTSAVRMALILSSIFALRSHIMNTSQMNHHLEREATKLDHKIKLLIQQATVAATTPHGKGAHGITPSDLAEVVQVTIPKSIRLSFPYAPHRSKRTCVQQLPLVLTTQQKAIWEFIAFVLQQRPEILAHLTRCCKLDIMGESFVEMVVLQLMGDQDDNTQERLLIEMFATSLRTEFFSTTDKATLLRGNSPLTNMLTTFARRGKGIGVLKHLLEEEIVAIASDKTLGDIKFEGLAKVALMKDFKEYHASLGGKPISHYTQLPPKALEVYNERVNKIRGHLNTLLTKLTNSVSQLPRGVRWIARYLYYLALHRFPDDNDDYALSIVGGFVCLRYLNPCIVSPQILELLEQDPPPGARSTYIILAKLIQQISNQLLVKTTEPHLLPFNDDIKAWIPKIRTFFREVTDVTDFAESLSLNRYLAHNGNASIIQTNLGNLNVLHHLLYTHFDSVCERYKQQFIRDNQERQLASAPVHNSTTINPNSTISQTRVIVENASLNGTSFDITSIQARPQQSSVSGHDDDVQHQYQQQSNHHQPREEKWTPGAPAALDLAKQVDQSHHQRNISETLGNGFGTLLKHQRQPSSQHSNSSDTTSSNDSKSSRSAASRGHGRSISMYQPQKLQQLLDQYWPGNNNNNNNKEKDVNMISPDTPKLPSRPPVPMQSRVSGVAPLPVGANKLSFNSALSEQGYNNNNNNAANNNNTIDHSEDPDYPTQPIVRNSGVIPPSYFIDTDADSYENEDDLSDDDDGLSEDDDDVIQEMFCENDIPLDLDDILPQMSSLHSSSDHSNNNSTPRKDNNNNNNLHNDHSQQQQNKGFVSNFFDKIFGIKRPGQDPKSPNSSSLSTTPGSGNDDEESMYPPQQLQLIATHAARIRTRFEIVVRDSISKSPLILSSSATTDNNNNNNDTMGLSSTQGEEFQLSKTGLPELRALLLLLGPITPLSNPQFGTLKEHSLVLRPKDPHLEHYFQSELTTNVNNNNNNNMIGGIFTQVNAMNNNNQPQYNQMPLANNNPTSPSVQSRQPPGSPRSSVNGFNPSNSSSSLKSNGSATSSHGGIISNNNNLMEENADESSVSHLSSKRRKEWIFDNKSSQANGQSSPSLGPNSVNSTVDLSVYYNTSICCCPQVIEQGLLRAIYINEFTPDKRTQIKKAINSSLNDAITGANKGNNNNNNTNDDDRKDKHDQQGPILCVCASSHLKLLGDNTPTNLALIQQYNLLQSSGQQLVGLTRGNDNNNDFESRIGPRSNGLPSKEQIAHYVQQQGLASITNPDIQAWIRSLPVCLGMIVNNIAHCDAVIYAKLLHVLQYLPPIDHVVPKLLRNTPTQEESRSAAMLPGQLSISQQQAQNVANIKNQFALGISNMQFSQLTKQQLAVITAMLPATLFYKYLLHSESWVRLNLDPVFYRATDPYVQESRRERLAQFAALQQSPDDTLPASQLLPNSTHLHQFNPNNINPTSDILSMTNLATLGILLPTSSPYWSPLFPHHLPPSLRVKEVGQMLRVLSLLRDPHVPSFVSFPPIALSYPYQPSTGLSTTLSTTKTDGSFNPTLGAIRDEEGGDYGSITTTITSTSSSSGGQLLNRHKRSQSTDSRDEINADNANNPLNNGNNSSGTPQLRLSHSTDQHQKSPLPPPPTPPPSFSDHSHAPRSDSSFPTPSPGFQIISTNSISNGAAFTLSSSNPNPTSFTPITQADLDTSRPPSRPQTANQNEGDSIFMNSNSSFGNAPQIPTNNNQSQSPPPPPPPTATTLALNTSQSSFSSRYYNNNNDSHSNSPYDNDISTMGRSRQVSTAEVWEQTRSRQNTQCFDPVSISRDHTNINNHSPLPTITPSSSSSSDGFIAVTPLEPLMEGSSPTNQSTPIHSSFRQPTSPPQQHISNSSTQLSQPSQLPPSSQSPQQQSLSPASSAKSGSSQSRKSLLVTASELHRTLPPQATREGYSKLLRRSLLASHKGPENAGYDFAQLQQQYREEMSRDNDQNNNSNDGNTTTTVTTTTTTNNNNNMAESLLPKSPSSNNTTLPSRPMLAPSKQQLNQQSLQNRRNKERLSLFSEAAPVFRNSIRSLHSLSGHHQPTILAGPITEARESIEENGPNDGGIDPLGLLQHQNSSSSSGSSGSSGSSNSGSTTSHDPTEQLCISPMMLQYAPDIVLVQRHNYVQRDRRMVSWLNRWLSEVHSKLRMTLLIEADDRLTSVCETNVIINSYHNQLRSRVQMYQQYLYSCQLGSTQQSQQMLAGNKNNKNNTPQQVKLLPQDEDLYKRIGQSRYFRSGLYYFQTNNPAMMAVLNRNNLLKNSSSQSSPTTTTTPQDKDKDKQRQKGSSTDADSVTLQHLVMQYNHLVPHIKQNTRTYSFAVLVKKGVLCNNLPYLIQQHKTTTVYPSLPPHLQSTYLEPLLTQSDLNLIKEATFIIAELKRGEYLLSVIAPHANTLRLGASNRNATNQQHQNAQEYYHQLNHRRGSATPAVIMGTNDTNLIGNGQTGLQYGKSEHDIVDNNNNNNVIVGGGGSSVSATTSVGALSRSGSSVSSSGIDTTTSGSNNISLRTNSVNNLHGYPSNQKDSSPSVVLIPPTVFEYDDLLRRRDTAKTMWAQGSKKLEKNTITAYTTNDQLSSMGCLKIFDKIQTGIPSNQQIDPQGQSQSSQAQSPSPQQQQPLVPLPYVNRGCVYGITSQGTPLAVVLLGQIIAIDTVSLLHRVVEKHFVNRSAKSY